MTGQEPEAVLGELRQGAGEMAKVDLALRALAQQEGLAVDDDEVTEELEAVAGRVGQDLDEVTETLTDAGQMPGHEGRSR